MTLYDFPLLDIVNLPSYVYGSFILHSLLDLFLIPDFYFLLLKETLGKSDHRQTWRVKGLTAHSRKLVRSFKKDAGTKDREVLNELERSGCSSKFKPPYLNLGRKT